MVSGIVLPTLLLFATIFLTIHSLLLQPRWCSNLSSNLLRWLVHVVSLRATPLDAPAKITLIVIHCSSQIPIITLIVLFIIKHPLSRQTVCHGSHGPFSVTIYQISKLVDYPLRFWTSPNYIVSRGFFPWTSDLHKRSTDVAILKVTKEGKTPGQPVARARLFWRSSQ